MDPQTRTKRLLHLFIAVAAAALAAPVAAGAATPSQYGGGLHIATGSIVDPNGRVWVADHNAGFCRMTEPTEDDPARIEHPEVPSDTTSTRTCLGGLLPHAAVGPDAAGAPAFQDPSPEFPNSGDEIAYVPDGASPSNAVYRLEWNPDSGKFEYDPNDPRDLIAMNQDIGEPDRPRPTAVSLGPDGNLYVVFQRSASIQRVVAPESATPTPQLVGTTSDADGATAIAAGRDAAGALTLYIAETVGIRSLKPNALLANQTTLPTPYDVGANGGPNDPDGVSGMAFDLDDGILYAGTSTELAAFGSGSDDLFRFDVDTGAGGVYASGFDMVGGVSMGMGDEVFVMDDPALLDPAEPLGMGRMWRVGPPAARILSGPSAVGGGTAPDPSFTNDSTPTFRIVGDGDLECSLELDGAPKVWNDCEGPSFTPTAALTDGSTYLFAVRASDGVVAGPAHTKRFTVDLTLPGAPTIARPDGSTVLPRKPYFEFSSTEEGASFECSLANGPYEPCATGRPYEFQLSGSYNLQVRAIDRAGNRGTAVATGDFQVDAVAPTAAVTSSPSASHTQQRSVRFDYSLANAEPDGVRFGCKLNDETFALCGTDPSGSRQLGPNLPDGRYTFQVHAMDAAGNLGPTATRTVTVDTTAPVVDLTRMRAVTGPTGVFPINANEDASFECRLDAAAFAPCNSGSFQFIGLAEGAHTLRVRATDLAGNVAPPVAHPFTVSIPDRTPPAVTISSPANGQETPGNLWVEFSASDPSFPVSITCRIDGVPIPGCSSPQLLTGLADGQHAFSVTATDADGNVRTVTRVWEVHSRGREERETVPPPPAPSGGPTTLALNPLTGDPLALGRLTIETAAPDQGRAVAVTLVTEPGTAILRLRVFAPAPAADGAVAARTRRKLVATEFRSVRPNRRNQVRLSKKTVRRLKAGRKYILEATPGASRKVLGEARTKAFRMRRR